MTVAATKQILMSDMFINNERIGARSFKVSSASEKEQEVIRGDFYAGFVIRENVVTDDINYTVITTTDKYVIIDGIDVFFNFAPLTDGKFYFEMNAYVDASNSNTFTFTANNPQPAGTPLNAQFVNDKALSTLDVGVAATVTGVNDYNLFDELIFVDSSANRESLSDIRANTLQSGRVLVIPPNSTVLIEAKTLGTSASTLNIKTSFYFREVEAADITTGRDI